MAIRDHRKRLNNLILVGLWMVAEGWVRKNVVNLVLSESAGEEDP